LTVSKHTDGCDHRDRFDHRERGNAMAHYVIRVKGTLSRELTNAFPSLAVHSEPAQTVLHGYLHDQAALAGVFNHLDMLGVDILEVMHVPQEGDPDPE
jgi:hypothetical protein